MMVYFETQLLKRLCMVDITLFLAMGFDLSWSIVTSDGLYWGIATSFTFIEHGDYDSYGLC